MDSRLRRVALLLFFSGGCALVYQVAWFRELRLVFGASTAASSAVLAIFMGGLGLGGAILGKRADASANPLRMYAMLEIIAACGAALSPLLVVLANRVYLACGGMEALGVVVATILRVVLSVLVLGPITFLMGGTMPAAARAVATANDAARRSVAFLYGANTAGAVVGTILATFLLLEVLGTRTTLWAAALVNALVGITAQSLARRMPAREAVAEEQAPMAEAPAPLPFPAWIPPAAAALAGVSFMLMELTWYRMLGPLLGGSSYTFGLILAVALGGIGVGGALYARSRIPSTLGAFAVTCALEALFIAIPYAAGDHLAFATLLARPLCRAGFGASVAVWVSVSAFTVFPAAVVSGVQFPLVIGLYGGREKQVGHDVGSAYLTNTLGSIVGALAGGFGLIPALGAVAVWKLVVVLLVGGSLFAALAARRGPGGTNGKLVGALSIAGLSLLFLTARGPTAAWRHSGIGAGRADETLERTDPLQLTFAFFQREQQRGIEWEVDGVESSVALNIKTGAAFVLNGKTDGHAIVDAPTQVMAGLLSALIHGAPKKALVIGLGTGSTAGWLAQVPTMQHVEVVELEPAILRAARECAAVNESALDNPKLHVSIADAREYLRTTREQFDIVFSEPSNPYRAGISSLFTVEYYRAARERVSPGGMFVQWIQAYEVDDWAVATAITTLKNVFADVEVWRTEDGDLLLVSRQEHHPLDLRRLRTQIATEPFEKAIRATWRSSILETVLSHYVGGPALADVIEREHLGGLNTDDENVLEFAFARDVGGREARADENIASLAARIGAAAPDVIGTYDPLQVLDETWLFQWSNRIKFKPGLQGAPPKSLGAVLATFTSNRYAAAVTEWDSLGRSDTASEGERMLIAEAAARAGTEDAPARIEKAPERERPFLRALLAHHQNDDAAAVEALDQMFRAARTDPWIRSFDFDEAFKLASSIAHKNARFAPPLVDALAEELAVDAAHEGRLVTRANLSVLLPDFRQCVNLFEALEPVPWNKELMTLRLGCYLKSNHPRAAQATQELEELLTVDKPPIGSGIAPVMRRAPAAE